MRGLKGKVAIVTGGAQSIGAAVVRACCTAGIEVVIGDVAVEAGEKLARELGAGVAFQTLDLQRDADIDAIVGRTAKEFGGIDFLINVAATYNHDNGPASTRQDWLADIDVNVVGGVMLANAVRSHMVKRGGGAVVNFGSISGRIAHKGRWVYPATKAMVLYVTRAQAMEFAPDKIRVNSVSPGWTWSRVMDELSKGNRAKVDAVAAPFHLFGRTGDPEDVANAVLFLCSDEAAFITGADIPVDGGYTTMGPERMETPIARLMAD